MVHVYKKSSASNNLLFLKFYPFRWKFKFIYRIIVYSINCYIWLTQDLSEDITTHSNQDLRTHASNYSGWGDGWVKLLLNLTSLTLKMRVMPACSRYSWASRDTVFSTTRMSGRGLSEAIFEMLFFKNSSSCGIFIPLLINSHIYFITYMFCQW